MKQFSYTIQGEHGLHARCAGKLVQKAQNFTSNISIEYNQRIENLKRLFTITCLGISKGDFVTVKVEGNDETEAANALENYFKVPIGANGGSRTPDLLITNQLLCQLSYTSKNEI